MSGKMPFLNEGSEEAGQASWLLSARLMPAPKTAAEKAAIAVNLGARPVERALTKTRIAFGGAAIAVAATVPNLSLGAMVSGVGGPYFGEPAIEPVGTNAPQERLASEIWTPAPQAAGPVYAETLADKEASLAAMKFGFSAFDQELPLAVLETGSEAFDLAFAGVETPSPLTALVAPAASASSFNFDQSRASTIATQTVAIEQITGLDLVMRATPENVRENQQRLSVSSSSARTDAIAGRSVEAAFAGAIDASSAVRNSLPVVPKVEPRIETSTPPQTEEVRRAIPASAPPPQVSATAAAQAALLPKTELDARVNGVLTGSVDFRQLDGTIAIRIRSVAHMMRGTFSKAEFSQIMSGQSIDNFVPIAELQAAGIPISYSPAYDEVEFGIDYKDAPNSNKVQIDQISIAPIGPELIAIEQVPR